MSQKRGFILAFLGEKGGVGKSTVTTNVAVGFQQEGASVVVLDADVEQRTSEKWLGRRNQNTKLKKTKNPEIQCFIQSESIKQAATELAKTYDVVIIDVAGRDSKALRQALMVADLVYAPVRPSQNDLETLEKFYSLVKETSDFNTARKAFIIFNSVPTNPNITEKRDAEEFVEEYKDYMPISNVYLSERKAYRDAAIEGSGVLEGKDEKAKHELKQLIKEIKKHV